MKFTIIGSTAIPGLSAKPIIDFRIKVTDAARLDEFNAQINAVGYEPKGDFGIPGRRYYQKGGDQRSHQIHVFTSGDFNIMRHLAFRDYLCTNPAIAQQYATLKKISPQHVTTISAGTATVRMPT